MEKVYCINQSPRSYMVAFPRLGFHAMGQTCEEAHAEFTREYGAAMPPFEFTHSPMPRPRRRGDEAPPANSAIEHDAVSYNALAKRFHPDLCGKRKFDAHTIMSIVNELRGL